MARGFLISESLHRDIKQTIARVDGMPDGPGATKIPTRFETIQQSSPQPIRLAAYPRTVSWNQGSTAQVSFYTHTGTAYGLVSTAADGTATALNVCGDFITLPNGDPSEKVGPTPTMTWCIVSKSRGGANVAVEGPQANTTLADRSGTGVWNKGSKRSVKFQGTTTEVQAYNLVGDYEDFDGRSSGGMPGLALAKGKDLGGANGTAWYVISPPAIMFRTGTFTGRWTKGQTKSITLSSSPTGTISVINNFGAVGTTASGSRNCAMSKEGTEWYLIAAECE
jgi:hypothetical protein